MWYLQHDTIAPRKSRSQRWRAGTRKNKKFKSVRTFRSDLPKI